MSTREEVLAVLVPKAEDIMLEGIPLRMRPISKEDRSAFEAENRNLGEGFQDDVKERLVARCLVFRDSGERVISDSDIGILRDSPALGQLFPIARRLSYPQVMTEITELAKNS